MENNSYKCNAVTQTQILALYRNTIFSELLKHLLIQQMEIF